MKHIGKKPKHQGDAPKKATRLFQWLQAGVGDPRLTLFDTSVMVAATKFVKDDMTFFRSQPDWAGDIATTLKDSVKTASTDGIAVSVKRLVATGYLRQVAKGTRRRAAVYRVEMPFIVAGPGVSQGSDTEILDQVNLVDDDDSPDGYPEIPPMAIPPNHCKQSFAGGSASGGPTLVTAPSTIPVTENEPESGAVAEQGPGLGRPDPDGSFVPFDFDLGRGEPFLDVLRRHKAGESVDIWGSYADFAAVARAIGLRMDALDCNSGTVLALAVRLAVKAGGGDVNDFTALATDQIMGIIA